MKVIRCVLTAFAMGVLLVWCTSESKKAAEKICEDRDSKESWERCVAGIVLVRCGEGS